MFPLAEQVPVHETQEVPQVVQRWLRDEGPLRKQEPCEHLQTQAPCAAPETQVPGSTLVRWEADRRNSLEEYWQADFESGVRLPVNKREIKY